MSMYVYMYTCCMQAHTHTHVYDSNHVSTHRINEHRHRLAGKISDTAFDFSARAESVQFVRAYRVTRAYIAPL